MSGLQFLHRQKKQNRPSCLDINQRASTAQLVLLGEGYPRGREDECIIEACQRCLASIFTDRAIAHGIDNGFDRFDLVLSVGVHEDGPRRSRGQRRHFTLDTDRERDPYQQEEKHATRPIVTQNRCDHRCPLARRRHTLTERSLPQRCCRYAFSRVASDFWGSGCFRAIPPGSRDVGACGPIWRQRAPRLRDPLRALFAAP